MQENKIQIAVQSIYLSVQSSQENQRYLWSYEVTITNESEQMVQLLGRHWRVTEFNGHVEEVKGPGVIGLQPVIKPGKSFSYSSFCQLTTPQGTMEGNYEMQRLDDEVLFSVDIPKFALSIPAGLAVPGSRAWVH